jgi:uncharacterized protein YhjY with autotransporter beta-barrel domain
MPAGTPGDDTITCTGIDTAGVRGGGGNDQITVDSGAIVSKTTTATGDATATASGVTIDAGEGNNQVVNNGSVSADISAQAASTGGAAAQATANAGGIPRTGDGVDLVRNFWMLEAAATAGASSADVSIVADGSASKATTTSVGTSTAIEGGASDDVISSTSSIKASSTATTTATNVKISAAVPGSLDATISSTAQSTGIAAGGGADTIIVGGSLEANANATTGVTDVAVTLGELARSTGATAGATSTATAVGISGGDGDDLITTTGTVKAISSANTSVTGVLVTSLGIGTVATPNTASATSTGVQGNGGADTIINSGQASADATAGAVSTRVSVSLVQYEAASDGNAKTAATATATGIAAGDGTDHVSNLNTIKATANAAASTNDISAEYTGAARGNSSTTATATALGIDGGAGADTITNAATLQADAMAGVSSWSVDAKRNDIPLDPLEWFGRDLGDSRTESTATATGVSAGSGDDTITNTGTVTVSAGANASTDDIVAEVSIGKGDTPKPKSSSVGVPFSAVSAGAALLGAATAETQAAPSSSTTATDTALVNAGTAAVANATGMAGDGGNDTLNNFNVLGVTATSGASSLSVGATLSYERSEALDTIGLISLGETTTAARAAAVGMDGGSGNDTITNTGTLTATANADAATTSVKAHVQADFTAEMGSWTEFEVGVALVRSGTDAAATATGIVGGEGDDTILNTGTVTATAAPNAASNSVSVTLTAAKAGLVAGASYADTATTATATALGIDGGPGKDALTNTGIINATATPMSSSTSVGLTVTGVTKGKGLEAAVALTDGTTNATGTATGMAGGDGDDTMNNAGTITVKALPDSDSASVSVGIAATTGDKGLVAGATYANAATTATATAVGMDGGAGNDVLTNTGSLDVTATPTSSSASVGVTISAAVTQEWNAALAGAVTNGTTTATGTAIGIAGGAGDDTITAAGTITVKADPDADSASVSATLAGVSDGLTVGFTYADGTTSAEARATAIDGGAGNDIITHSATTTVTALPTASSAKVGATITGATKGTGISGGAALTDATTKAVGEATGIAGGAGDDQIANSGTITVKALPDADAASVSLTVGAALGEIGLVGGFSYADGTTTATATAIGIDGGAGKDTITNSGPLDVTAEPTSSSASVSLTAVGVKGTGAALGITVVDGTTTATGTAVGIRGGDGDDTITNSGTITVGARPDADSASVGVNIAAAKDGAAVGGSFADATTTAQATATGIDGEAGDDTIRHTGGKIDVTAAATSSSVSVIASAQGAFQAGAAIGAALTDGTTKAIADATGIAGGAGNDTIGSSAPIEAKSTAEIANASVTVNLGYANTGLAAGVAAADGTTTASSTATGIAGGAGNDVIDNAGSLLSDAHSTVKSASVSVHAGVAVEGVAAGVALADAKTVATSTAYGIAAGDGVDSITNRNMITTDARSDVTAASVSVDLEGTEVGLAAGAALSKGETTADALAIGISGGGGNDYLANSGTVSAHATTDSTRTNVSVKGGFSLYGMAIGASIADGSNIATADARAVEGGSGNDTLINASRLDALGKTTATTTTVAVDVELAAFGAFSASIASSSTTATARATGMSGGDGSDGIENTADGTIVVGHQPTTPASTTSPFPTFDDRDAIAKAKSISVSIAQGSFSQAEVTTTAEADSRGIDGGSGKDTIVNAGSISTYASATTDGQAGTGNLFGYGAADISLTGRAKATGIDGGADDDIINNKGTIVANADSTTTGRSVSVNLAGGLFAKAGATAETAVVGLQGNAGADQILNQGTITLGAKTHADVGGVAANLVGYSNSDATNTASGVATAIDGGDGADLIINDTTGSIIVNTSAHGETAAVTVNLAGAGKAEAGSTASAIAIGLSGGAGSDEVQNAGTVTLSAKASTDASSTPVTILGKGDADAQATTTATAVGISGGEGANTLANTATGVLSATAEATGTASSYSITVAGGTTTDAQTVASASATGIAGGSGADGIANDGRITATATSTMTAVSVDVKGVGGGVAHADSSAEATAVGIDGGAGSNIIRNNATGSITVSSSATAGAGTGTTVGLGVSGATASTGSVANATGIAGGSGQDDIANAGTINATAASKTKSENVSLDLASFAISTAKAEATAEGINGGGGNDLVVNTGTITVAGQDSANPVPMAFSDAVGGSFDLWDISISVFGAEAKATGILGGAGNDTIVNQGTITVGDDNPMAKGSATGVSGSFISLFSLTGIETRATATAIGIDGGDGNDAMWNDTGAKLTVKATAAAWTTGNADTTFGEKHGAAAATVEATATGLSGGAGDDAIINKGTIAVTADSGASPTSVAQAGWGKPVAQAEADATATAYGINGGSGNNLLVNHGTITVSAASSASPLAYAEEDAGALADEDATSRAFAVASAYGIVGGAGQDVVLHTGLIHVSATAVASALAVTEDGDIETPHANATAVAVGIQTGSGNDIVETGPKAKLTAEVWTTQKQNEVHIAGAAAQVIGIDTGDGDDVVIHGGSIVTKVNGAQGAGVGISTGAGNDTVTLLNGSSVAGSIDLGAGDDTLTLEDTSTVTGAVTGAAGTDTIVFSGAGSAAFTPVAFEYAVKDGAGTFTMAGLPTMQRLEIRRGTLHLDSAYRFSPTGLLQATIYGDGNHGQLSVAGQASLDGSLEVLRRRGLYRNGTRYDILTADALTGWFADVRLPEPTPLVSFRLNAPRDHVEVEALVNSFTTAANNPHHQRLAQHLDTIMPSATGDLAAVLGEVQALPASGLNRAFASLSPASYDSATRATVGGAWQYTQSLRRRLEAVRAASTGTGEALPAQPVLLAALDSDASLLPLLGAYHLAQPQAQNGLWLNGFGEWGDQEATPGFSGFTFGTGGATLGYDHTFADHVTTGLSVGYAHTDLTLGDGEGKGRIQNLSGSLYGSYFTKSLYVEGAVSYMHNWYDNERKIVIGAIERTAKSQHEADAVAAYLGAGYAFPLGAWGLGPVGSLRYVYLAEAGFQETGADALNLQVARRGTHSLVSELGLRLTGVLPTRYGTWLPEVGAAWSYDFDVDDHLITTTYAGAPGTAFSVQGQPVARHGGLTRVGLTLAPTPGLSLSLRYTGEFRDDYQSHGVLGEVRVAF